MASPHPDRAPTGRPRWFPSSDEPVPFTEFYTSTVPRLVAFLRVQGASLPDAADCVQDAMEKAFVRWSSIRYPYSWCRTTVTHEWGRRLRGREQADGDPEASGTPLLRQDLDVEEFEQRHDFLVLLDRLPLRQRQVMALTYDGAGPSEIAGILGIDDPDTVRSSLYKARVTLRNLRGGETP